MASVKASALKQQLRSQFLNSNTRSITEEHTRIAEEYLQELRKEQGDGYKLTLDLINLEHLLRLNDYNHSTIILALEVLLSKYIVNLLQRQLPHKWWSLNTRNPQFSHCIKVMEGWMEIMKVVGYSEVGDAGTLTFPSDQRIAPDRSKIGLIAAELLITKTDLNNHPISHCSSSSSYAPPLEHRVRSSPKPCARTMAQFVKGGDSMITDTINESMGYSTAKFQQPLSISQESSYYTSVGRSFQTPHWDEDRSVADEVRESREDGVDVLRHNEYTHAPNVYSETASITNDDEEDDEANQLKKLRKVLSEMKKVRVSAGRSSAPLLNLSTTEQPPQQLPPSLQPNSPSKQRKAPPVPKKRSVFLLLETSEGESSRPALSTRPSHSEDHIMLGGQLSTEQAAAASSSSSPSLPDSPSTPSQVVKNAAEVEHFKQFTPEKQREYLDAKQYHNESILHLIPHFKGVMPKDPIPVYASDSDIEEERRKRKVEEDGSYLLNYIKDKTTSVYVAAKNGHVEALSVLISTGADINAADKDQRTPAHIAAYYGHVDILKTLYQHGANLNTKDKWNDTPLDDAIQRNHSSVVEFLKAVGEEQHTSPDSTVSEDTTPNFSVDDDTAHEVLEQEVGVSTADLMLTGSPGSGKTSVMHLSLNEPPPDVRNSTGCVETPVRAIASGTIYADGTMMKKLETEEMLDMVCGALRHKIEKNIRRQHEEHINTEIHRPVSSTATPTPTQASLEDSPRQNVAAPPKADNAAKQQVSTPQAPATTEEEKLKVFAKLMKEVSSVKASPDFLSATLVSTTDSGGQPQFMDACSLLLRSNSLFMITVKLNERLDDKPKFDFFINGKPISMCSISLQLTNLQLIESIAKTVSSIQLSAANAGEAGSQPRQAKFMLIGTFADKAHECEGETIADKNRILKERLKHFKAELVDNGGDIIFPVNAVTTDPDERQKAALQLQEIITNTPGTLIKANIKLRWFGLLMHMLDVAEKKGVFILRLEEIIAAGKCLMMSEEETRQAVKHFHDMNLISHHSTEKLDQLVFVNSKPILDQLTNLIGVAFIDKHMLDEIFQTKVPINAQELLKDHGLFSQSLLESCFSFPAPLTAELFLNVLEHLSMIACIEKDGQTSFFLPSALPHAPEDFLLEKEQVSITPWILRLKMRRDAVLVDIPIPKGYLPTLVILLITSRKFEADLDDCGRQYRNVMSILYVGGGHVYFIERTHQLEIYYSWDKQLPNHCSVIRSEIMNALVKGEEKLRFKPDILTKEDVFICSCNGTHPRHFCTYKSTAEMAICEKTRNPRHLSKQQQCWILPPSQVDRVGVSSPPAAVAGSPHSQATPGSPVTSSVSSATTVENAAVKTPTHHSPGEQSTTDTPPTADQAADDPLNKPPKMNDLLNRVASRAMDKWEVLGLQLNIPTHQLNTIQKSSPILCFAEVFNLWERKSDPPFTWDTIVEALRSPIVNENNLAKEIEDWLK